jgi:hypothetical protein
MNENRHILARLLTRMTGGPQRAYKMVGFESWLMLLYTLYP